MGSGQSSAKAAEAQEADTSTQLFGSWDKPVAEAYAKKASKKGKAVASKAADAANEALGSAIDLEAGAGVKPLGRKSPGKQKGAGTKAFPIAVIAHNCSCPASCPRLHFSSVPMYQVRSLLMLITSTLPQRKAHILVVIDCAGPPKGGLNTKKRGEAWTLSQSTKDPAKVTAAEHALKGKLSKPVAKKAAQVTHSSIPGQALTLF